MATIASENNKAVACRFLDLIDKGDVEEICKLISPEWKMYGGPPGLPAGEEGIRVLFSSFGRINQKWTVEDVVAEENKVVVRATNNCEQDSFLGIPASGRQQTFTAMFMHYFEEGKILETWRNANDLGRVLQLGAVLSQPTLSH